MKLPDVEKAEIREAKVVNYLLSTTHPSGKSKAAFFTEFGFSADRWEELAVALTQHAVDNEVAREESTAFGTRYIVEGRLKAPDGTWLNIRCAWFVHKAGEGPKFVTAHPLKRRGR